MCGRSGRIFCIGGATKPTGPEALVEANDHVALPRTTSHYLRSTGRARCQKNPYGVSNNKAKGLDPLLYDAGLRKTGVFGIPVCTTETFRKNGRITRIVINNLAVYKPMQRVEDTSIEEGCKGAI